MSSEHRFPRAREVPEMARTVKTTKTQEQGRAEAEQLHDTIPLQVEALRASEAWTRFLDFSRALHRYSLNNLLLILGQAPKASHVDGYRMWQGLNRQVRKGERGIRISADERSARRSRTLRRGRKKNSAVLGSFPCRCSTSRRPT